MKRIRALQYAYCDWTRGMSTPKRLITWVGILLQGYALYALDEPAPESLVRQA